MKKKTIFQCVILFFSILNIHVGMAGPEQVSMHIYGNVVDQGCDVATKSALQNIHIGDFNISDFQAANTVSTAADLNIDITGCAAGITGADVLFSGEADTLAPTLLKLTQAEAGVWQRGLPCKFLMRKVSKKSRSIRSSLLRP